MALDHLTKITSQSGIKTTLDYAMSDLTVDTITVRSGGGGLGGNVNAGIVTISSLTVGTIPYVGTGQSITENDNLTWDNTNVRLKNLGITSTKDLNVTGIATFATDIHVGENIAHLGDTDTKIVFTNNQIDFHANSASRLYINQHAAYFQTTFPLSFLASTGPSPYIKSGGQNNQSLLLTSGTDNPTRLAVKPDGKIGIGTTNPDTGQFQVVGGGYHAINITGNKTTNANKTSGISFLNYAGNVTSVFQTYASNSGNFLYYGSADGSARGIQQHSFYINDDKEDTSGHTEALRITSAGQVHIGVATENANNNAFFKAVVPDGTGNDLYVAQFKNQEATAGKNYGVNIHAGSNSTDHSFRVKNWDATSAYLFVQGDGNIGIGEDSPSYILDVKGDSGITQSPSSNSTAGQISIVGRNSSGSASAISRLKSHPDGSSNQSHLAIETRNSSNSMIERLRITSDGYIKYTGFRTGDGENKLGRLLAPSHDTDEEDVMYMQIQQEDAFNQLELGGGSSSYNAATAILFRTAAIDTQTGRDRIKIDELGHVGIGTRVGSTVCNTNQSCAVQSARVTPDGMSAHLWTDRRCNLYVGSNSGWAAGDGGVIALGGSATGNANQESVWAYIHGARQSSNGWQYPGYFEVGTRPWAGSTMKRRMRIYGDGQVELTAETSENTKLSVKIGVGTQTAVLEHLGSNNMRWRNPSAGTFAFDEGSDYRLKENPVGITNAISTIKQLKPYQYTWKHDNKLGQGFLAHEAQEVLPDIGVVSGTKDAVYTEDDKNGGYKKGDPIYQGIDYSRLVPLLTAGLKEAVARIETLEAKVATLES